MLRSQIIDPATLLCDFYKVSHRKQYPKGTEYVYSTWTARGSYIEGIDKVVAFGFQAFIQKYLIDYFNANFFWRPEQVVVNEYVRIIKYTLGEENPDATHIRNLHRLGYLPIKIKAIKEGTLVPVRVPMLTIENTHPEFFWLTNYLETLMSAELWGTSTAATIALEYRKILDKYAMLTGGDMSFVPFQGHDFSMRGMLGLEACKLMGMGHLLSFVGTDTVPAIINLERYYNAFIENELVGTSIPATEHSVMCAHGQDEMTSYRYLITEVYPSGFVSIVSDTWDYWNVLDTVIRGLKPEIMSRDGRVVVRPDSGDPVKILCGDPDSDNPFARKGTVEVLWDMFGGTITENGFKQLDSHIGAIYGDAITRERCEEICQKLMMKGFASTNVVYGIGSFSYQYNTRDTFKFALKSTHVIVDGVERKIFKDPVTDNGTKKSLKGRVIVARAKEVGVETDYNLVVFDNLTIDEQLNLSNNDELEDVFVDGKLVREQSLAEIRKILVSQK